MQWNATLLHDLVALQNKKCDPAIVQRVGRTLRAFLKSDDWARQEARLLDAVSREQPVVVTIRSVADELYILPWELLPIGASGQHLGELPSVLVRYERANATTEPESPSPRPEGGRILFAWSAAGGYVPVSEHLSAIKQGAQAGHHSFDPEGDVLQHATCESLQKVLKAANDPGGTPISVLHLLCHGSTEEQKHGLVLNSGDAGEPTIVHADNLGRVLHPYKHMVRLVVIAACNGGNFGKPDNQLWSIAQKLHMMGIEAVIASRFPLSIVGSNRFSKTFYRVLLGGPSSVESAFLAARQELVRDTAQLDWASMQLYACGADGQDHRPIVLRPYRGLLTFQPEHRRFLFGRDAEINEIINDLGSLTKAGAPRFLVIAGESGHGKSSVVLAGAVPRMCEAPGSTWVFKQMRPGTRPLTALDAALSKWSERDRPLLLVVDQFEEVFTQTESKEERDAFVRRLWALAGQADSGVSVIVTLRVDFIGRCGEIPIDDQDTRLDKIAYDEAHRIFVRYMTRPQLEEIISKPAQLVGLTLEPGLARRMLEDIDGEPGALPLLQDTLDILWQHREGRQLTQAAYDKVGCVTGALQRRADAEMKKLDETKKKLARRLLVRLVSTRDDNTAKDTRRQALLEEIRPRHPEDHRRYFDQILGRLVDERLLVSSGEGETTAVEVAHEALIRKWKPLQEWLQTDREKLAQLEKLKSWVKDWKSSETLLSGRRLDEAKYIAKQHSDEVGEDEKALIKKSRSKALNRRILLWLVRVRVALAVAIILILCAFGLVLSVVLDDSRKQRGDLARVLIAMQLKAVNPEAASSFLREVESEKAWRIPGWLATVPICTPKPEGGGTDSNKEDPGGWRCVFSLEAEEQVVVEIEAQPACRASFKQDGPSSEEPSGCMEQVQRKIVEKLWTDIGCFNLKDWRKHLGKKGDAAPDQANPDTSNDACQKLQACLRSSGSKQSHDACFSEYRGEGYTSTPADDWFGDLFEFEASK
ncbi:MAG TPA: CHAT domain-containing protein [Archangium sp.]|uniref:nSTAND1 domain-containing NTPase n=1 Tax=Archangium sp. TaxID=1872627 RepID=UPI002E30670D|nr:CHAT domain-containing protein [Archangium sp.]HEX5748229.1 CHAT domain-containing protein [Archangium sp.]